MGARGVNRPPPPGPPHMILPLELRKKSLIHVPSPTFQGLQFKNIPLSLMVSVQGKKVQKVRRKMFKNKCFYL